MKAASARLLRVLLVLPVSAGLARAQRSDAASLSVELNSLHSSQAGCRLSFVATSTLETDIEKVAYEMALFDQGGLVERITVFDFREIPAGKTRVRQFDLPGTECAAISRVLLNDARTCAGPGLDPTACMRRLKTVSKSGVAFSD
jgi:hypothetical protein